MSDSSVFLGSSVAFGTYVEPMRFGAQYCKPVARMLLNSQPSDIDAAEKKAFKIVIERADAVQAVVTERERFSGARVRPVMQAFGNAWSAGHEMLSAQARIDGARGDDARELDRVLFSDGLTFLRSDALAAWFEGQRRLDRIEEEGLAAKLASLLGAAVLTEIKSTTAALGDTFGGGASPREVPTKRALQQTNAEFARAVAGYARVLSAKVDESDRASVERFLSALAPLDEYRAARASRGTADDEEDDTEITEVTPVTPGPTTVITNVTPSPDAPNKRV